MPPRTYPPFSRDSVSLNRLCTDFPLAIAALDADVLSIENSKSDAKLLKVFIDEAYPRHIGPGTSLAMLTLPRASFCVC